MLHFSKILESLTKGSKWSILEVRIDGEDSPYLLCREFEKEKNGKVISIDFEITSVSPIESSMFKNNQ